MTALPTNKHCRKSSKKETFAAGLRTINTKACISAFSGSLLCYFVPKNFPKNKIQCSVATRCQSPEAYNPGQTKKLYTMATNDLILCVILLVGVILMNRHMFQSSKKN